MIGFKNKKIGFILDSSCGIHNLKSDDLKILPLQISVQNIKNNEIKNYKDNIDIKTKELEKILNEKKFDVKTSQVNIKEMCKACDEMCKKYDQVFVLPIHQKLSNNFNTWNLIKNDYVNLNVLMTFDIGGSFIWTLQEIKKKLSKNEYDEKKLQNFINNQIIPNRIGFLMVNDLTFLIKGGRLRNFKILLTKLLKIKSIILFDKNGLSNFSNGKNNDDFFKVIDQYISKNFKTKKIIKTILFSPTTKNIKNKNLNDFKHHYNLNEIETQQLPNAVTCHTGANYIAIYLELK